MPESQQLTFDTCFAEWDGATLTVGNDCVRRRWRFEDGGLRAQSIEDLASGFEWLSAPSRKASFTSPSPATDAVGDLALHRVDTQGSPVEAPSLKVQLRVSGATRAAVYTFQAYKGVPAITTSLSVGDETRGTTESAAQTVTNAQEAEKTAEDAPPDVDSGLLDVIESFALAPEHLRLIQVTLETRTDFHNELAFGREWLLHTSENNLALQGCLFIFEDTLTGRGLICLKHAPLPEERPVASERDLLVHGKERSLTLYGHGIPPEGGDGYPSTVLCYQGSQVGRTAALHRFQRAIRTYVSERDGLFLCNTWGDRSQDSRINEPFMDREIEAGARLGVEVVQVDDGWQRGRSTNSTLPGGIREGFWDSDPDYWTPHPERFPNGFEGLVAKARQAGMKFGLWFWPDNADDLANWEKDVQAITGLHKAYGIDYFKIDGVTIRSKNGERNLQRFFRKVQDDTEGRVVFDLDVTASVRPGYFGAMNVGPLFVENRYTDWHRYWPHQTLRNLWKLSRYVDPLRLRFEFLNHTRNTDLYTDDPLGPSAYRADCLFATVMLCSPLGWFEASNLPEDYIEQVAPLVKTWQMHRKRLFGGTVHPIGSPPDGVAWTGFASVSQEGGGYLLLFREMHPSTTWELPLPQFAQGAFHTELLGGRGSVELTGGILRAEIPEPLDFLFARIVSA